MVKLIASMDDVGGAINCLYDETGDYLSLLEDYRVTSDNMEFDNKGVPTAATLLILESKTKSGKCYTLAYATDMDAGIKMFLERKLEDLLAEGLYLKLGTGSVDASGNISLTLTGATDKLRFENPNIVQITGTKGADTVYIQRIQNTNGVSETATLDFSTGGKDTIKFNGETIVKNISGGGQPRIRLL